MGFVCFGQPDDGLIQTAYVVEDIHQAIREWASKLKVGRWFLVGRFTGEDAKYYGKPTEMIADVAISFAGHLMIELIQQRNDVPSVYRDTIEKRGYGFHHWGLASANFERDVERYRGWGYELAFSARVPSGGRVAYMDTTAHLPGMVELFELGASFDAIFSRMHRAATEWDGKELIRPFA